MTKKEYEQLKERITDYGFKIYTLKRTTTAVKELIHFHGLKNSLVGVCDEGELLRLLVVADGQYVEFENTALAPKVRIIKAEDE